VGDREGEGVRIAVHDSGTTATSRRAAGRGRGLSIAARALEDAHGSLEAPELLHALERRGRGRSPRGARLGEALRGRPGAARPDGGEDDRPHGTEVRIELPLTD
jgi:hypothetical protein